LCGDFNIVPAPIDSWNERALVGHIFHTTAERTRLQRLVEWGFTDLFRQHLPDTQFFTWWDYRAGAFHRNHGLRIDLLLGTPSVAARVRHVEVDREYRKKKDGLTASDHAPVIAELG
jgi:exodeoxyribonuclease-3